MYLSVKYYSADRSIDVVGYHAFKKYCEVRSVGLILYEGHKTDIHFTLGSKIIIN